MSEASLSESVTALELDAPNPELVITLIHGTFAPDAAWTRRGSPFISELANAFEGRVRIERFPWTARNSIFDRRMEAERLIDHLWRATPGVPHFLIAHSHGGNLALYAAEALKGEDVIGGVVCLSTPFLHATVRDVGYLNSKVLQDAFAAILFIPLVVAEIYYGFRWWWFLAAWVGCLLLSGVVAHFMFLLITFMSRYAMALSEMITARATHPANLLIIRSVGDEAALALMSGQALSWASTQAFRYAVKGQQQASVWNPFREGVLWKNALRAWGAVLTVIVVDVAIRTYLQDTRSDWVPGVAVCLGIAYTTTWMDRYLFGAAGLAFAGANSLAALWIGTVPPDHEELGKRFWSRWILRGLIGLATPLIVEVNTEASPVGAWTVYQYARDPEDRLNERGLLHSSYNDRRARQLVGTWLRATRVES